MLLLLVLTLLAISGMNTASLELVMAGNTQYRQNAFQAAENGIERSLQEAAFNPGAAPETVQG
ncbi:MAG: pilus assembly protein PilX, partial [Proteobacteria bacterium]